MWRDGMKTSEVYKNGLQKSYKIQQFTLIISLIHDNAVEIPPIQRELLVKGSWTNGASLPPCR